MTSRLSHFRTEAASRFDQSNAQSSIFEITTDSSASICCLSWFVEVVGQGIKMHTANCDSGSCIGAKIWAQTGQMFAGFGQTGFESPGWWYGPDPAPDPTPEPSTLLLSGTGLLGLGVLVKARNRNLKKEST